ncbi:glucosamine inositolphosphorylceramide transferase family protein [Flavobacterium collinsii]|uniref:Glucosamine inositolphosphorylceramide transferase 1 N-terminal domain-containing protein n=1 Tax=Flavobacterium collinsii TaxID=1114861 RepID=A0ABM8KNJ1_9FLAO|nr:hypothetical protein [Flavobacterium collinsii]CAA9202056.1 hypothetical protein FLACOL7796_04073 [Flavobacterium collinsii]
MGSTKFVRYNWSIAICFCKDPIKVSEPGNVFQQVLTGNSVTDVPASFVADPFMIKQENKWYMFFEVMNTSNNLGEIGLAHSEDLINWTYDKIVLREDYHLSYPSVIQYEDKIYMIPESRQGGGVRLYEAVEFPHQWKFTKTLIKGDYADPSVFYHNDKWWMFALKGTDELQLFFADALDGKWELHPQCPLIPKSLINTRPAGRPLFYNGRWIRFAQDGAPIYGNKVRAFEIDILYTTTYKDHEITESPILKASRKGWNSAAMHHIDAHKLPDETWVTCIDGADISFLIPNKLNNPNNKSECVL